MNRPRVVLDTNVVVSAAITPGGLEAKVVELVAIGALALCASDPVIAEYEAVLGRSKFAAINPAHVARLLRLLKAEAVLVGPPERLKVLKDEDDNRFLECAETARANYLITGNRRHFPKRWKSTRIVNAREFLKIFEPAR
jgi:putative PIN family toxin of toxin-antitoxin system